MVLNREPQAWYRDGYMVSTDPELIQVEAVNAALGSDLMWWAQALPRETMQKALRNSLCFGLYELSGEKPDSRLSTESAMASDTNEPPAVQAAEVSPRQIGLARVVTDDVTFAYLTDMYVLKGYHGTGLGTWVMSCVDEVIRNWPHLRRFVFLTADKMDFYRKTLGAKDFLESEAETATFGIVEGPAAKHPTV